MATALIDAIAGSLDRDGPVPLTRQLYEALRAAILAGRLAPGPGCRPAGAWPGNWTWAATP
ncbi:hypothetical protein [Oleomonas cavernae]|uniref:hypothetical protein n=1 Tax=Oleomonas cavernae TaxID=2320859 RepID=UPI001F3E1008|nr:hypothetical protein [Oleomonas cavernae]